MNCILVEIPRRLTLSVKPFGFTARHVLGQVPGVTFRHVDLNPAFWRHACAERGASELFERLCGNADGSIGEATLAALARVFPYDDCGTSLCAGLPVQLTGLAAPAEMLNSSQRLVDWSRAQAARATWREWAVAAQALLPKLQAGDVVAFGIDSNEGFAHAAILATLWRAAVPGLHLCIGRHAYESYSLLHNLDAVIAAGALFEIFDSLVVHDEAMADSLARLCRHLSGDAAARLHNLVHRNEAGVLVRLPREPGIRDLPGSITPDAASDFYFQQFGVPADSVLYLMELVRNRCYFAKCTFCTHINRHASAREFEPADELRHSLGVIATLHATYGIRNFSLIDEAIAPRDLRHFSERLLDAGLDVAWTARLIADRHLDHDLLQLMARAGCREVLFGLETVHPETARAMRKISADSTAEEIYGLIARLDEAGIDVILNFIYRYPTESDVEFAVTRDFIVRLQREFSHLIYIVNPFELYAGSQMFARPGDFNIRQVEARPAGADLKWKFNYLDGFGRVANQNPASTRHFLLALGLSVDGYRQLAAGERHVLLRYLFDLAYSSFGFVYRCRWGRSPVRTVIAELAAEKTCGLADTADRLP